MSPLVLALLAYVFWVACTANVRFSPEPWGPDWVVRCIDTVLRCLAHLAGVSLDVVLDSGSALGSLAADVRGGRRRGGSKSSRAIQAHIQVVRVETSTHSIGGTE